MDIKMSTFVHLWRNFPSKEEMEKKCRNVQPDGSDKPFSDYCSIRLSEAFNRTGIVYTANGKCWSHSGKKHILLAENLANGLKNNKPQRFGKLEIIDPNNFQSLLKGRTGVIFFKDYWKRGNESFKNRSGDHIDLWNKSKITGGSMLYRSVIELFGFVSDLNNSKEVWFWEVK
jgi:hypothetical protein